MNAAKYNPPLAADVAQWASSLDDAAREHFEERAAIREFDGGLSRRDAERTAMEETILWLSQRSESR